ncbi:hypothetical protein [Amycolatopsis lurida]|uniref:hypothetical protein n=1 Tax=Amycolatopsis lurida TaxID=31959 RepID=UPI0036600014
MGDDERLRFVDDAPQVPQTALAQVLFTPDGQGGGRWGWTRQQSTVEDEEFGQVEPVWSESNAALERYRRWQVAVWQGGGARIVGAGLALIAGGLLAPAIYPPAEQWTQLAVVVGAVVIVVPLLVPPMLILSARRRIGASRRRFDQAHAAWTTARYAHEEQQRRRQKQGHRWEPVRPDPVTRRVDVWGGTGDSWASLVATLGGSLLAEGTSVAVVDFSEQHVGAGLALFARQRGLPVVQAYLPRQLNQLDPLARLAPAAAATLIAEAVDTLPSTGIRSDDRTLHKTLIHAVAEALGGELTWARLVAGLQVLRRAHGLVGEQVPLSSQEIRSIIAKIDLVQAASDRVGEQIQRLVAVLSPLTAGEIRPMAAQPPEAGSVPLWPPYGLSVVSTGTDDNAVKELVDALLVQRLIIDLARDRDRRSPAALVLAGADHLGVRALEMLGRRARASDVQFVLLLSDLREELRPLLGVNEGATILMRLGNPQHALTAAEYIGRDYKFVLSQVTRSVGENFSRSRSASTGHSDSTGRTDTSGRGMSREPYTSLASGLSSNTQETVTRSRAQTWQDTVSTTTGESEGTSRSRSRVYEFQVEPVSIQSLPATAFILVEYGQQGRRVVAGDCNPGLGMLAEVWSHQTGRQG